MVDGENDISGANQYAKDFEVGLTLRLDDLEARLASMETDLATIKRHPSARMPTAKRGSNPNTPLQKEPEKVMRPGESRIDPRFVAARLNLTGAQSKVAVLLAEGLSVSDIAAAIGCKVLTVRWHLKMIHHKLNIQRQTQLVRLVLLLPHRNGDEDENDPEELESTRETN